MAQFDFKAIGTSWHIDIPRELSSEEEASLLSRIMERIELFDKAYSRFRADSLVTEMSQKAGTYKLPEDADPMMKIYRELYLRTDGLVTPLIGNLISDAGYDPEYSLVQKKPLEAPPKWNDAIEYDPPNLIVKKPVMLDFGAAGKGYLIDIVGGVLEKNGISEYCIDAGGDILHKGEGKIRIGLENPQNLKEVIGVMNLANGSIAGSSGARRAWGDYTHIINPKTLASPRDILASWAVAETALVADALATCLFFVAPETLSSAYDFEWAVVRGDRSLQVSDGFPGEFFS